MSDLIQQKLRALPIQTIEIKGGVILKRGCVEVKITGEGVVEALAVIFGATNDPGATREEICEMFTPHERPMVEDLISQLVSRRLIVPNDEKNSMFNGSETELDVFYWQFNQKAGKINERMNKCRIAIVGINHLSCHLAVALSTSGVENYHLVDDPQLRNVSLFDHGGKLRNEVASTLMKEPVTLADWMDRLDQGALECVVATSDFGARYVFGKWNRFCVNSGRHFFPAYLDDLIGYIGPFVIPGETACFECFRSRHKANIENSEVRYAIDDNASERERVMGILPPMASVIGDIAAVELIKFYSTVLPTWNVGKLIEVNLLATQLTCRRILKIPRCEVCSPLITRQSMNTRKSWFPVTNRATK